MNRRAFFGAIAGAGVAKPSVDYRDKEHKEHSAHIARMVACIACPKLRAEMERKYGVRTGQ